MQPDGPHVHTEVVDRTARPPSGRRSPAPCLASIEVLLRLPSHRAPGRSFGFGSHAKQRLTCGNTASLRHPFHMLCCMPTRPAYHMSHVMNPCVGVMIIPATSGESGWSAVPLLDARMSGQSRLASVSPGACWSKSTIRCIETRCKVPMLEQSHKLSTKAPKVPCLWDSS